MKCGACGHDSDEFKKLELIELELLSVKRVDIEMVDRGRMIQIDLYLCPKCGTVRGE